MKFFHLTENGKRVNQLLRVKVVNVEPVGSQDVSQAVGRKLLWMWAQKPVEVVQSRLMQEQQVWLMGLFSEEEVIKVVIKGLNGEEASGLDGILVFLYSEFWGFIRKEVMASLDEFHRGTMG